MNSKLLIVGALASFVVGCAPTPHKTEYLTYHCEAEKSFEVAYFPEKESAILRVSGQPYPLIQVPSGSGARYILDDKTTAENAITLYTKGNEARLELEQSVYKNCKTD